MDVSGDIEKGKISQGAGQSLLPLFTRISDFYYNVLCGWLSRDLRLLLEKDLKNVRDYYITSISET